MGVTGAACWRPVGPSKHAEQRGPLPVDSAARFTLMRRSLSRFVAWAIAVGVLVSACSSTDRMAAPVEEEVAVGDRLTDAAEEVPVEPDAAVVGDEEAVVAPDVEVSDSVDSSAEPDGAPEGERVTAFARGVRVCVMNERTTRDGKPAWIVVKFDRADRVSRESSWVAPGSEICGEASWSANLTSVGDLLGSLITMYDDTRTAEIRAINYAIGETSMEMIMHPTTQARGLSCSVFRENSTEVLDDTINRFTLKRLPDSGSFKEYTITVSDGQSSKLCFPGYY